MLSFSVIIVTHKRVGLLKNCLDSLLIHKDKLSFEVFVILNGEDQETVEELEKSYIQNINLIQTSKKNPGEARNLGIKEATKEFIFFLDDDTILPSFYFNEVQKVFKEKETLDIFGGPDTDYPNSTDWEKAISLTLKSPLATATTRFRHASLKNKTKSPNNEKLILCNMWVRRKLFEKICYFDKRFYRNEENVLIHKFSKRGANITYFPQLFVYHKRKKNLKLLSRAVFISGAERLKSFIFYPDSINYIFFIPFLFLNYLVFLIFSEPTLLSFIPLLSYFALNFHYSYNLGKEKGSSFVNKIFFVHFIINLSYGFGFYYQIINFLKLKLKRSRFFNRFS